MDYRESIQQLRGTVYYNRRLIRVNQDIEVLRHQMTGLARSGPVLSPQQAKSPLPLPHYQHDPNASPETTVRTGTAFLWFAPPRGFASLCDRHCSTCVAQIIRGMMI